MTELIKDKNFFQITCEKKSITELVGGGIQIEGYASTKDKDRGSDIVEPKAFKNALDMYMLNPVVLLQHDAEKPVGIVVEARIDSKGLYIKANITEDEDGIFSKLKNGVVRSFSIGYRVKDFEDIAIKDDDGNITGMETVIKDLELFEISLVSIPMNPYALMKSMKDCFKAEITKPLEERLATQNVEEVVENVVEPVVETIEEIVEEPVEEVIEENNEENNEEIAITTDTENEINEEDVEEQVNTQVEEEIVETEELPNEEVETEEICEEGNDNESVEEVEEVVVEENANTTEETEENSEIDDNLVSDNSENGDETAPISDEISTDEKAVNLKELSRKSLEIYLENKVETIVKGLNAELSKKDEEIKSLKEKLQATNELLGKFAECLDTLDSKMENTIQNQGFAYQTQTKKKSAYSDLVNMLKS